jgi:phage/plasmid-like protein (TIGR03299 family)
MPANVETMFYHGERPWHGLGTALDHPATSAEAITAAGLDWPVELKPATVDGIPIPRARAVVRMDRMEPIAVVGERYVPVQNAEAFAFFDQLIGEGQAAYETAGALDRGRRIWLLARLPGEVWVTKEDNVGKYLLLTTSHDGVSPLRALFTPIRVVCQNTLRAAMNEAGSGSGVSVRHVGDVLGKAEVAKRLLEITVKYYDTFEDQSKALAGRSLTGETVRAYFRDLVPDPKDADPARAVATRETLVRLFETGRGNTLTTVRGTLWAALNAVAEFVDHERPTRVKDGESAPLKRFESALFGSGASLKERAWSLALARV